MSGRNFSLTTRLSEFVDREVACGRHQNASEVVREALRRYENDVTEDEAALAVIRRVADDGMAAMERGQFTLVSGPEAAHALLTRLEQDLRERQSRNAEKQPGNG